jgi:hypothetical protein
VPAHVPDVIPAVAALIESVAGVMSWDAVQVSQFVVGQLLAVVVVVVTEKPTAAVLLNSTSCKPGPVSVV